MRLPPWETVSLAGQVASRRAVTPGVDSHNAEDPPWSIGIAGKVPALLSVAPATSLIPVHDVSRTGQRKDSDMHEWKERALRIAALNDQFRRTLKGGLMLMSRGIVVLPADTQVRIMQLVKTDGTFIPANNPHEERDFGICECDGRRIFWKIDAYQTGTDYMVGAESPDDPATTDRVLTVMLDEEY